MADILMPHGVHTVLLNILVFRTKMISGLCYCHNCSLDRVVWWQTKGNSNAKVLYVVFIADYI